MRHPISNISQQWILGSRLAQHVSQEFWSDACSMSVLAGQSSFPAEVSRINPTRPMSCEAVVFVLCLLGRPSDEGAPQPVVVGHEESRAAPFPAPRRGASISAAASLASVLFRRTHVRTYWTGSSSGWTRRALSRRAQWWAAAFRPASHDRRLAAQGRKAVTQQSGYERLKPA